MIGKAPSEDRLHGTLKQDQAGQQIERLTQ